MEVREAIAKAKEYFNQLFSEERITEVGLEEVAFDDLSGMWMVTIGFARASFPLNRWYKVITLDDTGRFRSIKIRETTHV